MRGVIVFMALFCIGLLVSGCTSEETVKVSLREAEIQPVLSSSDEEGLKIAVSAMISPKSTFVYYREILDYISQKMGLTAELIQRDTYAEINDLVRQQKLHAAFVCTGAYITGHEEFGMELLAVPQAYGELYYYSYIIVPDDSEDKKLDDLRGKKFAFTDPMSNTGKLAPTYMLAKMGETPDSFFGDYIFTYNHDKSIEAVARKFVDGAAVDSLIWDYMNAVNPEFTSGTKIIRKSRPYGIPPVVVPKELDAGTKEKLRNILLGMHLDTEGRAILDKVRIDKFVEIEDSAYDSVRRMKAWLREQQ